MGKITVIAWLLIGILLGIGGYHLWRMKNAHVLDKKALEFTIIFEHSRPGQLLSVARLLSAEHINIEALAGIEDSIKNFVIKMITNNPQKTVEVLTNNHVTFTKALVNIIDPGKYAGQLTLITKLIAEQNINIESCYLTEQGKIIIGATDDQSEIIRIFSHVYA